MGTTLFARLPERLDWLWFLGFDLDTKISGHNVLSKARKRWGVDLFRDFFDRIVLQCVEGDLVDGGKIFMDSNLIEADALKDSVVYTQSLKHQLRRNYRELEARLEGPAGGLQRMSIQEYLICVVHNIQMPLNRAHRCLFSFFKKPDAA